MIGGRSLKLAGLALLAGAITLAVLNREQVDAAALQAWVSDAGLAGPLLFILIYAIGTVLFLPGSVLTLAGGALFGPVAGTVYNLAGATIGATLAFVIARYLASDWVRERLDGKLGRLVRGVETEGWRFVAFVRLVPLFPFNLLNYALGLTRINLAHYVAATLICMIPAAFAYTYLGYAGREAVTGSEGLIQKGLLALGLLALVAFLPRLIAALRRGPTLQVSQLKERLDKNDLLVLDVRGSDEFDGELGHIQGARNIPLDELPDRVDDLLDWQERPVAIVCRTDKRSAKAARILARNGFGDVHVVRDGMEGWNRAGLPVMRD